MHLFLTLTLLVSTVFESTIDRAFTLAGNSEWVGAASALDQANAENPALFAANNFHYLRGRVAENQGDWNRAREEFKKIAAGNPLYGLATWHAARASAQLRDDAAAEEFLNILPRDFPTGLKLQVANGASAPLAMKIYQDIPAREARFQRAKALGETNVLWSLLRERKDDDVALECAHLVQASAAAPKDQLDLAGVYVTHRQFEYALPLYQAVSHDSRYDADARYQIARIHFLRENYQLALETYQGVARDFAGTGWQKDSEYQIAAAYWRLGDFRNSEKGYAAYIESYGSDPGAVRNLVDVYRVLGENQKALSWIDRTLAKRLSVANRQVLLFTKAKVLYSQKKYKAALQVFRQLGRGRIRSAPGGTTADEVQYFQALCLSKAGNKTAAETIWRKLADGPFSYYGQRAAEKLGRSSVADARSICSPAKDDALKNIEADLESLRHPLRSDLDSVGDAVSELLFLRLWDEASLWVEHSGSRPNARIAAEIAYLAGRYHRAIIYADRLPKNDSSTLALLYPAGYRQMVCRAANMYNVDPLWLHAIIWQESKYDPMARSTAAARGLMQFIPETANAVGAAMGMPELSTEKLYDPAISIQMGAQYWSSLIGKLNYPEMALAAYNGGPNNVERWRSKFTGSADDRDLFVADIGFVETKKYVLAVFTARAAYASLN